MDSHAAPLAKKKKKFRVRVLILELGAVFALYVVSYAFMSATGGWMVSESGELRTPLAASDIFLWQPRHGSGQWFRQIDGEHSFRGDFLGFVYFPLIAIDQRTVHRTIRFRDTNGIAASPIPAPPLSEYHPLRYNRFYGRWPHEVPEREERKPRSEGTTGN